MMSKRKKKAVRTLPQTARDDQNFEIGHLSVEDPDSASGHIRVVANIRHDVLVHWRARKQIDDVQFLAGQKLQALWYRARSGQMAGMRYESDRVDGGVRADPFSEQMASAASELRNIAGFLGQADFRLATRVLCEGQSIEELARAVEGREPHRYIARRVRDALTALGDFWGTKGKGGGRTMRSFGEFRPLHGEARNELLP